MLRRLTRLVFSFLVLVTVHWNLHSGASAHVSLLAPNGGEQLVAGDVVTVIWQVDIEHDTQNWDLAYSVTGPNGPWISIAENIPPGDTTQGAIHTFEWTIPANYSDECRVQICQDNSEQNYYDESDADFSIIMAPAETVSADSVTVLLGSHSSGQLSDIDESDDNRLCYNSGAAFSPTFPELILEIEGTAPTDDPSTIKIVLEGHAKSNDVTQRVWMFNFDTSQFELVDTRPATLNVDSVAEVHLQGDVTRFVEMGTGLMRTKIDYKQGPAGFFVSWQACIDQFVWEITQ